MQGHHNTEYEPMLPAVPFTTLLERYLAHLEAEGITEYAARHGKA
jgi:hypothetical protein